MQQYLAAAGFSERPAQTALYEHLILANRVGVVAQAGTGTGKSAAVLAAAAQRARIDRTQALIVTPTLTLMNQYRDGEVPVAREAFPHLSFAELRGRSHYECEQSRDVNEGLGLDYYGGCDGLDAACSLRGQQGHEEDCGPTCNEEHEHRWFCAYQIAKAAAMRADVVVTNADMLIVNDKILAPLGAQIFDLDGALFVDEAHTLEAKFRDYASRSLHWKSVERFKFAGDAPLRLAQWIKGQEKDVAIRETRGFPSDALLRIANAAMPPQTPKDGLTKQRETLEACIRIKTYMDDPHENAVLHVNQGSLKMDWINIAKSSGELLCARSFGLVSATVPRTMSSALGVGDAPFIDVGHPFDYGKQAWIGFSAYGGDYKSAQSETNFEQRVNEVKGLLERAKGGALVLFSSFRDLEIVSEQLRPWLMRDMGLKVLIQERDMEAKDRQALADEFKSDGNAVLFGSESFATGFDVPGDALRLVVVWKLPYPAVDPVSNAIRAQSYQRYEDIMKVRAVQAIGRLIRRDTDRGIVWLADNRGRKLVDPSDPLTSHIPEFARL
jgi:ATP-dependent DNA helicase DinG